MNHEGSRRFFLSESLLLNKFFTIPSGSYSCSYPSRIKHVGMAKKGRDSDREKGQGQPEARALPEKVEKEVKMTRGTSHLEKYEARAPNGHHRDYIILLFVGLALRAPLFVFFFFLSYSMIVSHSPFACKWQKRFWDSKPIVAHFPSNKSGTSNIRIPYNSLELHPARCMRVVCRVGGLGLSRTSKQNVLSLILLIPFAKLMNQKRSIYRHCILYPLRLRPPFPNDAQTLMAKASLELNQISN